MKTSRCVLSLSSNVCIVDARSSRVELYVTRSAGRSTGIRGASRRRDAAKIIWSDSCVEIRCWLPNDKRLTSRMRARVSQWRLRNIAFKICTTKRTFCRSTIRPGAHPCLESLWKLSFTAERHFSEYELTMFMFRATTLRLHIIISFLSRPSLFSSKDLVVLHTFQILFFEQQVINTIIVILLI